MPAKCIVFGCNNRPNKEKGISNSTYGNDDTEKRKRRKKRVHFVKLKRAHWKSTKYSAVSSKRVLDEDYSVMFSGLTTFDFKRRFRKDDIGISIHATCISIESKPAEAGEAGEARGS